MTNAGRISGSKSNTGNIGSNTAAGSSGVDNGVGGGLKSDLDDFNHDNSLNYHRPYQSGRTKLMPNLFANRQRTNNDDDDDDPALLTDHTLSLSSSSKSHSILNELRYYWFSLLLIRTIFYLI